MSEVTIIRAKTAGFCFGVKRAVQLAFEAEAVKPTYTFGPIIHNDTVIGRLADKGIASIDAIEDKEVDTLIIRAHGIPLAVYEEAKEKEIKLIDATCPYVSKIHRLVKKYNEKQWGIIVIGDAKHPEIIGIDGWAENKCIIIKDLESIDLTLLNQETEYLIVSQTTYKKEVVDEIVSYLQERGYHTDYVPTICSATTERQDEAREMAKEVDVMIVIGSSFSSNTQKLYEICSIDCERTICLLDESELTKEMIEGAEKIGVTAGASTPDDVIEAVVSKVKALSN